jgi:hypothetical protein
MTEESIFQSNGQLRADLDVVAETLAPDRRIDLDNLVAATAIVEQVENEFKLAEQALTDAVRRKNEIASKVPRISRIELTRAAIASYAAEHQR